MKTRIQRREAILVVAASAIGAGGCDSAAIEQQMAETPTATLENTRVGLRGFQIVAFMVGKRLVYLPHPAVRILGVVLVVSATVTFLAVEYLDVELKKRSVREAIDEMERSTIESQQTVEFTTDNGLTETVAIGPTQYEHDNP